MRPAHPPGRAQPPHQVDRGPPRHHDVPLGGVRRALRGLRHRAGVQRPAPGAAAVFLPVVPGELGAVFAVWAVGFFSFFILLLCSFVAARLFLGG